MNVREVMKELEKRGSPQTKKLLAKHGYREPFFGVKVADLKTLVKKIRTDTALARELFATGNTDAMYLAGLIADGRELGRKDLEAWVKGATCPTVSESTVARVAAESPYGWDLALRWIDSREERVSSSGWSTLSGIVATTSDDDLDLKALERLLDRVVKKIHAAPNRTRYAMNGFVISVGAYVEPLTKKAIASAAKIGTVEVAMGETACKVPAAVDYIKKATARGYRKRESMKG